MIAFAVFAFLVFLAGISYGLGIAHLLFYNNTISFYYSLFFGTAILWLAIGTYMFERACYEILPTTEYKEKEYREERR